MIPCDPHALLFMLIAVCVVAVVDALSQETNR
jgi:Flp pilus assembly pilin Flp